MIPKIPTLRSNPVPANVSKVTYEPRTHTGDQKGEDRAEGSHPASQPAAPTPLLAFQLFSPHVLSVPLLWSSFGMVMN